MQRCDASGAARVPGPEGHRHGENRARDSMVGMDSGAGMPLRGNAPAGAIVEPQAQTDAGGNAAGRKDGLYLLHTASTACGQ